MDGTIQRRLRAYKKYLSKKCTLFGSRWLHKSRKYDFGLTGSSAADGEPHFPQEYRCSFDNGSLYDGGEQIQEQVETLWMKTSLSFSHKDASATETAEIAFFSLLLKLITPCFISSLTSSSSSFFFLLVTSSSYFFTINKHQWRLHRCALLLLCRTAVKHVLQLWSFPTAHLLRVLPLRVVT